MSTVYLLYFFQVNDSEFGLLSLNFGSIETEASRPNFIKNS